jgi:hypothetical protein
MRKLITILTLCLCVSIGIMIGCGGDGDAVADNDSIWTEIRAIWAEINTLKAGEDSVDMQEFAAPVGTDKTFEQTSSPTTLTDVIYKEGVETWNYADGSSVEHFTEPSAKGTMLTGRREYNTSSVMTQDLTYFPSVLGVDTTAAKVIGTVWGNAYIAKKPDGSQYGAETNLYTVIGIEDVTVPAGTFAHCIKVYTTTQNYKHVAWYAEGVGMVKRIGVGGLMVLK